MTIGELGYTIDIDEYVQSNNLSGFIIGRVTQEHRERYIVSTGEAEYEAEITGNLRFTAESREDFPAVGDWVTMTPFEADTAIIHKVLPRKTLLERQSVSGHGDKQIIAANIDVALIIQAIDNNFNINRLERYLTLCNSASIVPVVIISKTDLSTSSEVELVQKALHEREKKIMALPLSNITGEGLETIVNLLQKGNTYCVLGSSGVGKSTLINNLLNKSVLKTGEISQSTNKGRHITSHRELFIMENGAIIIDTPGMREVGITDNIDGITTTFEDISALTLQCKYSDCTHTNEKGCAVLDALLENIIDIGALDNYRKLLREQERISSDIAEKRKKDKAQGKLYKSILKTKNKRL